jgi:cytochrome b
MHEPPAAAPSPPAHAVPERQLVWDLPLRICHWALVVTVCGAFVTHWADAFGWHARFGYATLVLVAFRIAWGVVGPAHARFADFVRGPRAAWTYARGLFARTTAPGALVAGHNALGGWMVLLLLAALLAQASSGLFANDEIANSGPLYGWIDAARSKALTRLHRQLSDLIMIAVGLHVAAAFWYLLVRRENLIGAMVTGYKAGLPPGVAIASQRIVLAIVLVGLAALALWAAIASAPVAELYAY